MTAWTVEGVLLCPDCTLYIDCFGTLEDQQKLIAEHDCRETVIHAVRKEDQ